MAATISASAATTVPAMVAGAVEPVLAMDMKPTGRPAPAKTNAASMPPSSWAKGAMVQTSDERGGRSRIVASSPAMTWAISTA